MANPAVDDIKPKKFQTKMSQPITVTGANFAKTGLVSVDLCETVELITWSIDTPVNSDATGVDNGATLTFSATPDGDASHHGAGELTVTVTNEDAHGKHSKGRKQFANVNYAN
jgi:hypothetical protein